MKNKIRLKTRDSFWFLPAVYITCSISAVLIIVLIEQSIVDTFQNNIPSILLTEKKIAIELYASLVTAILTMTTLSFSVIMVVLTTFSTQFSPRTLQDFMRSRTTQHILGVYCFGFIFALLNLIITGKENLLLGPNLMTIIAIIELASFVYFIHHSARWIQVNNLITWIEEDGIKIIKKYKKRAHYQSLRTINKDQLNFERKREIYPLKLKKSGYVQDINWDLLVEWAKTNNAVIEMDIQVGDYVQKNISILAIYTDNKLDSYDNLTEFIFIGNERTDLQDVEFTIQKLVEIALRAISPAINDPHTAINSLYRIGSLLTDVANINQNGTYIIDNRKQLRIVKRIKTFSNYLFKSFYQIRHYGKNDLSIIYSMIEVLANVAMASDKEIRKEIWQFHFYILEIVVWDELSGIERDYLSSIYDRLKSSCSINES
ncbi:DUF2254 domain-containing protein [Gracilibacillus oryzae]|uniref:DUF2254 domain-containing protein n=1 Tax=Gracilibacillus oryzae TaxID=1672701 RepID=A0A7C8GWA9_9BACI|nr:DUF2254 domain-containing protein [Gracilibacillus oryzae]KAB8138682.1 DUF2254 domain-containing protein [Gracilibacillus oryzae]